MDEEATALADETGATLNEDTTSSDTTDTGDNTDAPDVEALTATDGTEDQPEIDPQAVVASLRGRNFANDTTPTRRGVSPELVAGVKRVESNNNPNAEGPPTKYGTAKGLMQLIDSTGEAQFKKQNLSGRYDPFNAKQNETIGTAELNDLKDKYTDDRLVLAAYNHGQGNVDKLIKKYGSSYEDIESHLPGETSKYVKDVTGPSKKASVDKGTPQDNTGPAKDAEQAAALPKIDTASASPDSKGLAKSLLTLTTAPEFDNLSLAGKMKAIKDVAYAKYWGPNQDKIVQDIMTNYIDAADPKEKPDYKDLVGQPKKIEAGQPVDKILQTWKSDKVQELINQGWNPAFLGDQLNTALDAAATREKDAYTVRNRGLASWIGNRAGNIIRDVAKGAASGITKPIGGITRLLGAEEAGNAIADLPAYLGKPVDDYTYKTDADGYLKLNPDKTPITHWQSDAAQMVGQVGSFLAGGFALKVAGYSAGAVSLALGGTNALSLANDSFRSVYEETKGDLGKSYTAALFSLPAAAVGTIGEVAVVAKWANPAISAMSPFNKAKYLANVMARNAAVGGASNLGMDAVSQAGEMSQTGKPFDSGRAYTALGSGALISGVVGGIAASGDKQVPQDTGTIQLKDIPGPNESPPGSASGAPPPESPQLHQGTVDEQRKAIQQLEKFQTSSAQELVITADQAKKIPPNLLPLYAVDVAAEGDKVTLRKKSTYVPQEASDLISAEKGINTLTKSLETDGSPNTLESLNKKKADLHVALANEFSKISDVRERQDAFELVQQRNEGLQNYEKARTAYLEETDPLQKKIAKTAADDAQRELESFDAAHSDIVPVSERIGSSVKELAAVDEQLRQAGRETYVNDIKAKEANLMQHLATRNELLGKIAEADAKAKGETPPIRPLMDSEKGIPFQDHAIINYKDKWYVFDKNKDLVGKGHSFYADAVETVKSKIANELPKITPGIRSENTGFATMFTEKESLGRSIELTSKARASLMRERTSLEIHPDSSKPEYQSKIKDIQERINAYDTKLDEWNAKLDKIHETEQSKPGIMESRQALKPTSLSLTRRRISPNKKPLSSKYTPIIQFPETSTKIVSAKEVFKPAQKLVTALSKTTKIFEGSATPKNVLGFLNYAKNYLVVARHNDPMTLLHEMKHVIDRAVIGKWDVNGLGDYSKLPSEVVNAAKDMAETYYPVGNLPENLKIQEGLAMFYQHYATGQPVHTDLLNWYKGQFAKENPKVFKAMEEIKDVTHAYFNQTPITFERSLNEPRPNRTADSIKRYNTIKNLNDEWTSKSQVLRDIAHDTGDQKLKDLYDFNYRRAQGITDHIVNQGPVDLNGNAAEGMSLVQALSPAKGKMDILDAYLNAKRDYAYQQAGLEAGSNVQDVAKIIFDVEKNHPEVALAADNYYKLQEFVHGVAASASKESAAFIQKLQKENLETTGTKHGYYLPRRREGKAGYNPLAKRTGSTRSRVDPTSYIEQSFQSILNNAMHSQFKEAMVSMTAPGTVSNIGSYIREVTGMERKGLEDQYQKQAAADLGPNASNEDKIWYSYLSGPLKGVTSNDFSVMTYMDGNKVRFFEIDPRISRLMSDSLPAFVNSFWFKYGVRPGGQILRPMATTLRAAFQVKNLIRDNLTANRWILSEGGGFKDVANLYKDVISSLWNIPLSHAGLKKDAWLSLADRLGVAGVTHASSLNDVRKEISTHFGKNILDAGDVYLSKFENILSTPETANRLAIMRFEARRLGITDPTQKLTPAQAMELVTAFKRGTTNFQDQGYTAQFVNMAVPFFTARIAEVKRLPDDFRKSPARMSAYMAAMVTAGLYHALSHKDDKWYNEMQPDGKMQNIWESVNIGGVEKAMFIPLDNWSSIGWGLGQSMGAKINEDPLTPQSYYDLARAYFGSHTPVNSFTELLTPVGKEALAQYSNYDSYFRKAIVPPSLEFVNPANQATEFTSEFSKQVGGLLGVSPIRIDHAIRSVAPAVSDVLSFADKQLGFKKSDEYANINFIAAALSKTGTTHSIMDRTQEQFRDNLMQFRENKPAETPEQGTIRKALERINKDVSNLNILTYGIDDQALKDQARDKKYELLRSALRITGGSKERPLHLTPAEYGEVEKLRKEKLAKQKFQITERVKDTGSEGALKGSTE